MKPHQQLGFKTKAAAVEAIRAVLYEHEFGQTVTNPLIAALLKLHPSYATKIGIGVRRIFVQRSTQFPTKCFWLERIDGSSTDFSFNECLKPSDHRQKVLHALRCEVQSDLDAIRPFLTEGCALCGDADAHHIDHAEPPFIMLAESWVASVGGWQEIQLQDSRDADAIDRFTDALLADRWRDYHANQAFLQMLCAKCNLSKGCRT